MSAIPLPEDEMLREQIATEQRKLTGLEHDLEQVDGELEVLAGQREQIALLEQVCGSLERLEELGGAELFWGDAGATGTEDHINQVRSRMWSFQEQVAEIETRRNAVLDRIRQEQETLDILEDDLVEVEIREEYRQQEWVLERELDDFPERVPTMPWSRGREEDERFNKALAAALLVALVLGLIIPWIELPVPEFEIIPEVPERFARLIEQELPPTPPPVVVEEETPPEETEPEPEPEPEPQVVEELPDEVVPEAVDTPEPVVADEPEPQREVRSAGILAFSDSFSSLTDDGESESRLGSAASFNSAGESAVGRTERSMVTSLGPGSSGGINLASLSRDVGGSGGQGIDGVEVGRVASSIGSGGTSDRPLSGGASAGRTDEEIQIVFDRYKAALYRLYNRELRNDPTLRGQVVLKLTIEPDGSVSFCEVQSSDMNAAVLEQQIVDRVLTFDFGAKEGIAAVTILYPIDFLPAA
jgi:outer membrane biosynthesis protein TonB